MARAQEVERLSGMAEAIDADILSIGRQRVILWGVDAPEPSQQCQIDGQSWDCNAAAKRALESLIGRGEIDCLLTGDPDPFGRRFGVCLGQAGVDVGRELGRTGMALAYLEQADDYERPQMEAIMDGLGLWQPGTSFVEPWAWRIAKSRTNLR